MRSGSPSSRLVKIAAASALLPSLAGLPTPSLSQDLPAAPGDLFAAAPVDPCVRPFLPVPAFYETRQDFIHAREIYYRDASRYVSVCIEGWVRDARNRYEEMYQAEVQGYMRERQAVLDEVRKATTQDY